MTGSSSPLPSSTSADTAASAAAAAPSASPTPLQQLKTVDDQMPSSSSSQLADGSAGYSPSQPSSFQSFSPSFASSSSSPSSSSSSFPSSAALLPAELLSALVIQLEFYFSRDNLQSDAFLLSQMDRDRFVPVATIAAFRKVRQLTASLPAVVAAMRLCANLVLDESETLVRPSGRSERQTVIVLREVPDGVQQDEVRALFAADGCPCATAAAVGVRQELGLDGVWLVSLDTEGRLHRDAALADQPDAQRTAGQVPHQD